MKAEDLKLDELVTFENGVLDFRGRRVAIHDMRAMAQFRSDLVTAMGLDDSRRLLTRFGYYWGHTDAAAMRRVFSWENVEELLLAGPRLHTLQGVTKSVVKSLVLSETNGLHMEVQWYRSGEAEEHLEEFGIADHPVCWMLCGYASGYASFCLDTEVFFVEHSCRAMGDELCQAIGKNRAAWGAEVNPYLAYYQTTDIHPKIVKLTESLKHKTRKLERHKQRLSQLRELQPEGIADVRSKAYYQVLDLASRVARFDSSVLITGESGVGKEVIARHIHANSDRVKGEFVAVNCGALPESLLESELFGHKSGSFTGAVRDRKGLFEHANGGTIFLDEISEVSPALQVKLLRVLQEREVRRLGENTPRRINARVMAASNMNLETEIRDGSFREDLYYRLRVVEIPIPPLRERPEDILALARFIVKKLSRRLKLPNLTIDGQCLEFLQRHPWPGNVRELENALERAAVLSEDGRITPDGLPEDVIEGERAALEIPFGALRPLKEVEDSYIQAVLRHTDNNRSAAAKILNIGVTTLWRRLKDMGAEPEN